MLKKILPVVVCGSLALCIVSEMDKNVSMVQPVMPKKIYGSDTMYVNMQEAMMKSMQGKQAQKVVESEEVRYADLAQKEQQRMMNIKNDLDTKGSMLNMDERRKMENEFNGLQRDYQNKIQDWRNELQYAMQRETDTMIKEIEQAAKTLAINEKKELVVDVPTGRILYINEDRDNTDDLIALLDNQYMQKNKAKPAMPGSTPAPVAPTVPKSDAQKVAKV